MLHLSTGCYGATPHELLKAHANTGSFAAVVCAVGGFEVWSECLPVESQLSGTPANVTAGTLTALDDLAELLRF